MKIIMIAPTPFFSDRGCHIRIYEEIRILQDKGFKVVLCTYHNGRNINNIDTERIVNIPWYKKTEAGPSWHKLYLDLFLLIKTLKTIYREKPDIIHCHLHEGCIIGWLCNKLYFNNIPTIFDMQGSLCGEINQYDFTKSRIIKNFLYKIEGITYRISSYIICSSEISKNNIIKNYKISSNKIRVISDGINKNLLEKKEKIFINNILKKRKIIIYSGGISKAKGVDLLLKSVPLIIDKYSDAFFLIIGYPVKKYFVELVKKLGIEKHVYFSGRVNYFDLGKYLNIADIAVDTKSEDSGEASGKIVNYMGVGLPIVCFDHINNRKILGKNGIYAKQKSYIDLAQKIIEILNNDVKAKDIGNKNHAKAEKKYLWEFRADDIINIYKYFKNNENRH